MPFGHITLNPLALSKLAARGITVAEVVSVLSGTYYVAANHAARVEGSVLAIGPTRDGRYLTIVLDPIDGVRWRCMTAWDSTPVQIRHYRRGR